MPTAFSLVTFSTEKQAPISGVVVDNKVYAAVDVLSSVTAIERPQCKTMLGLLSEWAAVEPEIATAVEVLTKGKTELKSLPLASVKLLAPILYPSAVYGSGANYVDHLEEMAKVLGVVPHNAKKAGQKPWHFIKVPRTTIVGTGADIPLPRYSTRVDWEVELAVVIGKTAKNVALGDAMSHVAGYTISNDLSARDHVKRDDVPVGTPFAYDWHSQKCFDGACPIGPAIVPARFVKDPQNLTLRLWVNGELMQDSNSDQMIFNVADQIEYLSSRATLYPGDVILTGTPAGVGMARNRFLKSGDVMRLEIEGLGTLENKLI